MGEVLYVEIARKTNSTLRRKEILHLVKKAVDIFENPIRDFCIHNHRHLYEHIECIKLCSYAKTWKTCRSDGKQADSEKKAHGLLTRLPIPTVIKREYYMFKLFEAGENEENLEESFANDGPRASHHWILPSRQLQQEWETLVFEPSVKTRLLDYMKMAIIYSQKHVNDSLIAWSKVVLLYGPPGTGKTTLCKAFAHKATIRLGGYFDYGQLIEINSNSLFSKYFSESGKLIERMFSKIHDLLEDKRSIVFLHIDEVESLATSRKSGTGSLGSDNIRAVNCLLTQLDKLKRYPNLVILTTSNIVDSIDVAFVDRADIKLCIGNPSADLIYEIYAGSINELIRCDIVQTKDDSLLPPSIPTNVIHPSDPFYENAQKLWNISVSSVNLSGRTLKRIPFLTHCNYLQSFEGGCTLEEYLDGMILAVEKEKVETKIIAEKSKSDKLKPVYEEFPQFLAVVKHSSPTSSHSNSPCVTSSTKVREKKFTASSVSSNFNSSSIYSSRSSSSSSYSFDSDPEARSRSNLNGNANSNANANSNTKANSNVNLNVHVNENSKLTSTFTSEPKAKLQAKPKVNKKENTNTTTQSSKTPPVKPVPVSSSSSSSRPPGRPRSTPGPKSSKIQSNVKETKRITRTASEASTVSAPESEAEPQTKTQNQNQNQTQTGNLTPTTGKNPPLKQKQKCKPTAKRTRTESHTEKETKSDVKKSAATTATPLILPVAVRKCARKTSLNENNSSSSGSSSDPGKLAVPEKRRKCEKLDGTGTTLSKDIDEKRMKRFKSKYRLHPLYIDLSKSTCTRDGVLIPFQRQAAKNKVQNHDSSASEQPECVSLENFDNDQPENETEIQTQTPTEREPEAERKETIENHIVPVPISISVSESEVELDEKPHTPTPCIRPTNPNDLDNATTDDEARNSLIFQFLEPLSPSAKNMGPPMTPRNKACKDDYPFKLDEDIYTTTSKSPKSSESDQENNQKQNQSQVDAAHSPHSTNSSTNSNLNSNSNSSSIDKKSADLLPIQRATSPSSSTSTLASSLEIESRQNTLKKPAPVKQSQKPGNKIKESPKPAPKNIKQNRVALNGTSSSLSKPGLNGSGSGPQNPGKTCTISNSNSKPQQSKLTQIKAVSSTSASTSTSTLVKTTPSISTAATATATTTDKSSTAGPKMIKKTRKTIQKVIRVRTKPVRFVRKVISKTCSETKTNPTSLQPQASSSTSTITSKPSQMPIPKSSASTSSSSSSATNPNGAVIKKPKAKASVPPPSGKKPGTLTQLKVKPANVNANVNANASINASSSVNAVVPSKKETTEKPKHQTSNQASNTNTKNSSRSSLFATFDKIKTAAERKMIVKPKSPQKQSNQTSKKSALPLPLPVPVSKSPTNEQEKVESRDKNMKTKNKTPPSGDTTETETRTQMETETPGCSNKTSSSQDKIDGEKTRIRIDLSDAKRLRLDFKVCVLNEPQENVSESDSKSTSKETGFLSRGKSSAEEEEKRVGNSVMEFRDGNKLICSHCNTGFPQNQNQNLLDTAELEGERGGSTCSNCGKDRDVVSCSLCGLLFNSEQEVEEHETTCLQTIDTPPPHEDSDLDTGFGSLVLGIGLGWPAASLFPITVDNDQDHDSVYSNTELISSLSHSHSHTHSHPSMTSMTSMSCSSHTSPGSHQIPSVSPQTSEFSSPPMSSSYNSDAPSICHTPYHNNINSNNNHSLNSSPAHSAHMSRPPSTLSAEYSHGHRYSLTSPAHTPIHRQSQQLITAQPFMSLSDLAGALLDPKHLIAAQQHFPVPISQSIPMSIPMTLSMPTSSSISGSNFHTCRFCQRCFISVHEMRQHVLTFHAGPVPAQFQLQLQENQLHCNNQQKHIARNPSLEQPLPQSQEIILPNKINENEKGRINGHSEDQQSHSQSQSQSPNPNKKEMYLNPLDIPHVANHSHQEAVEISVEASNF